MSLDTRPIVYFAQADYGGPIKIGSTLNYDRRLDQIARELPFNLVPIGCFPGDLFSERFVQCWFRKSQIKGEWFEPSAELLRWAYQARAHDRVHQVPCDPGRDFKASSRALKYHMSTCGLTAGHLAEISGTSLNAIKSALDKPSITSTLTLAAYSVAVIRRGHSINWNHWGLRFSQAEPAPASPGEAA